LPSSVMQIVWHAQGPCAAETQGRSAPASEADVPARWAARKTSSREGLITGCSPRRHTEHTWQARLRAAARGSTRRRPHRGDRGEGHASFRREDGRLREVFACGGGATRHRAREPTPRDSAPVVRGRACAAQGGGPEGGGGGAGARVLRAAARSRGSGTGGSLVLFDVAPGELPRRAARDQQRHFLCTPPPHTSARAGARRHRVHTRRQSVRAHRAHRAPREPRAARTPAHPRRILPWQPHRTLRAHCARRPRRPLTARCAHAGTEGDPQ